MATKAKKDSKIANDGEHGEKRESMCTVGRNVNWCNCHGKHSMEFPVWKFLKNLKIELPHDSEISLLGVYPKEMKLVSQGDNVHSYVHHRIVHDSQDTKTA